MPFLTRRVLILVCCCALIGGVVVIAWQARAIAQRDTRIATLGRELQELRSKAVSTAALPPAASAPARSGPAIPQRAVPNVANVDQLIAAADSAQRALAASQTTVDQLNARIRALEAQQATAATSAEERATAADARWKQSLDNANLTLEGVRTDLRTAKDEIAQLQADNQALREARATADRQASDATRLMAEYRDISRRRDAYLTSILQRYRDVTRQYRSAAAVVSSRRNDAPGALIDEADLGRIQSALTSAQDDIRQIEALNAQAQLIERKLAGK